MSSELHSFRLDYRITNISNKEIIVKIKGGLSYIVQSSREASFRTEQELHVNIRDIYLDNLKIEVDQALTKLDRHILVELQKEQERVAKINEQYHTRMPADLNITLNLHKGLVERNNAIHSELLGITLYIGSENISQPALMTPKHTMQELFDSYNTEEQGSEALHYFIYANDPQSVYKTLYTNIMGKTTEVPVDHDVNKQPGLYVGTSHGIEPRGTQYYAFGELDDQKLIQMGLFKSKADCDNGGGNTDRFLTAESKYKELSKDNKGLVTQIETLQEALGKAETKAYQYQTDLTKQADAHRVELNQIKLEHRLAINESKHTSKMASDLFKFEAKMKDTVYKANTEFVKQKGAQNSWGDFAKAIGTLAGVAITGYKLLTA